MLRRKETKKKKKKKNDKHNLPAIVKNGRLQERHSRFTDLLSIVEA